MPHLHVTGPTLQHYLPVTRGAAPGEPRRDLWMELGTMQATLLIQKVNVCLQTPWRTQPTPGAGAQDPGISYGKTLDLMFAVPMPGDAFWTTWLRPWAVFEPGLVPVLQSSSCSFSRLNM